MDHKNAFRAREPLDGLNATARALYTLKEPKAIELENLRIKAHKIMEELNNNNIHYTDFDKKQMEDQIHNIAIAERKIELYLDTWKEPFLLPYGRYCLSFDKMYTDSRRVWWKGVWSITLSLLAVLHEFKPDGDRYAIAIATLGGVGILGDVYLDYFAEDFVEGTRLWSWAYLFGYVPARTFCSRTDISSFTDIVNIVAADRKNIA
jgi:hypothetical protein